MSAIVTSMPKGNFIGAVHYDEFAQSPREDENLGTMICRHRKYSYGDEDHGLDFSECTSWEEDEKVIRAEFGKDAIMLPIYMMDHSGVSLRTHKFSCRFDSGRVGTIVVSRKQAREMLCVKRITKNVLENVIKNLEGELETYNQYINGECYRFEITSAEPDEDGEIQEVTHDSCCGFYDLEYCTTQMNEALEAVHKSKFQIPNSKKEATV